MKNTISDRQIEIIETSGKILMEKGIKGLTTKNLAAEIGFSESAIYRHFKNKEDIIVVLLNYLQENIENRLSNIISNDNNAEQQLKQVFASQFSFFKQNPHFVIAILSEGLFDETEKIQDAIMKIVTLKSKLLQQIIEIGKQHKEFTQEITTPDLLHIIMGSFRLSMLKWKLSKFQFDIEIEGNRIINNTINLIKIG
jgi:AcrR family transcriptional regulator